MLLKNQNSSQSKRLERSSSQIVNHIQIANENTNSVCSFIPSQKEEFDAKEERKHELLYTNKTHSFFTGFFSSFTLGMCEPIDAIAELAPLPVLPPSEFTAEDVHAVTSSIVISIGFR